jgi:hypothetical protein
MTMVEMVQMVVVKNRVVFASRGSAMVVLVEMVAVAARPTRSSRAGLRLR